MLLRGRRSRWQSEGTWNSPPPTSTSKIHLRADQVSQNTYWKQADDLIQPKLQERSPHSGVGWREKGGEAELGWDLCPWEGAVKEERFPHPTNLLHQLRGLVGQIGSFRGSRGECGPAGYRETSTDRPCHVTALSTCLLVCAMAGFWNLGFSGQSGERIQFGCTETARRAWSVAQVATEGACRMEHGFTIRAPLSTHERRVMGLPYQPLCQHAHNRARFPLPRVLQTFGAPTRGSGGLKSKPIIHASTVGNGGMALVGSQAGGFWD